MAVSRADNSVKNWRNLLISNPKPDLHNINAYTKFGENQTMIKTPVKFQKDQFKTVGGVALTSYLHVLQTRNHAPRKAKYYVPSLLFKKAGDNKNIICTIMKYGETFYGHHTALHTGCSEVK